MRAACSTFLEASGHGDRVDVNQGYYATVRKDYREGTSSYHYESSGAGGGKSVGTNSSVSADGYDYNHEVQLEPMYDVTWVNGDILVW